MRKNCPQGGQSRPVVGRHWKLKVGGSSSHDEPLPLQPESLESQTLPLGSTTNFPEAVPETVREEPRLKPLEPSLKDVGLLKASAPVVEVEAVERYIATLLSVLEAQVVVVPSISALVPLEQTSRVSSVPVEQFPEVEFEEGVNLIKLENSMTIQG